MFSKLLQSTIKPSLAENSKLEQRRTIVQLVGSIARYSPHSLGPALGDVLPGVLAAAEHDDAELMEGALQTLETVVLRCPTEVSPYLDQVLSVSAEKVKYDPVCRCSSVLSK